MGVRQERPEGKQMYCSCRRAKKQGFYPETMPSKMSPYYQSRKASLSFSLPSEKHDIQCICTYRAQDVLAQSARGHFDIKNNISFKFMIYFKCNNSFVLTYHSVLQSYLCINIILKSLNLNTSDS